LLIWVYIAFKNNQKPAERMPYLDKQQRNGVWGSKLAWQVALFMGLQSVMFYVIISWLAEILIDFGLTKTMDGFMVSYFQLLGITVSTIIPILAVKLTSRIKLVFVVNMLVVSCLFWLLLFHSSVVMIFVSVRLIGI